MNDQTAPLQTAVAAASSRSHISRCTIWPPSGWVGRFFASCALLALAAFPASAQTYQWTNFAGMPGGVGAVDGTLTTARFRFPGSVAVDGSGNIYVTDTQNQTIRKITPGGVVSTLAGLAGSYGSSDGTGSAARFWSPFGIAVDGSGNVYVADGSNHTLRKITPGGVVSTLAGLAGSPGSSDGTGSTARFNFPAGVAVDSSGNVYVSDAGNNTLRKVTPAGVVSTLAGQAGYRGSSDGTGGGAQFSSPTGMAIDGSGNLYVTDNGSHTIRKVTPAGVVSTLAGLAGSSGSSDGTGSTARFNWPNGVAVDASGNLYVADQFNSTIRKVTPAGVVTTLAGLAGSNDSSDGTGSDARFWYPSGVAMDQSGNIIVADSNNNTLRKVTPDGVVSTLAGQVGFMGSADGTGSDARFWNPLGVVVDGGGNVYVADSGNHTIRKVTPGGMVSTLAGQAGYWGGGDGTGSNARFNNPAGLALDSSGNLYVADPVNHTIRKVTPGGVVSTLAGQAGYQGSDNGTGSAARFYWPNGVAVDSSGNIYVADSGNNAIRKVTPGGVVSTLAGGPFTFAFNNPYSVAVDSSGNVYVADNGNNAIRKVTPGGVVSTLAGQVGFMGSADGTGSAALFNNPAGLAMDAGGNLYVADTGNHTIRKVTPGGVVTTIGGTAGVVDGVDGLGAAARFSYPSGIAVSSSGALYIADTGNNRISMGVIVPAPTSFTVAAGVVTATGATLNGMVNANGLSTSVSFEYGLTTAYGASVSATPSSVTGGTTTGVSAALSGLSPGTTYHFRISSTNTGGTANGDDQTFTTAAATPMSWRQQWYSTTGNSGSAADSADPYHTGVPNLVAFALFGPNQNPAQAAVAKLPQPHAAGGNFVYSFTEPAGVSGITYGAQYSTSLNPASWQPVTDTGSGTQHVFSIPIGGSTQVFMRLTLTNIDP